MSVPKGDFAGVVEAQGRRLRAQQRSGLRPHNVKQRSLLRNVRYLDVLAKGVQVNPVHHLLRRLRVGDHQKLAAQVDHGKQVYDAALVGGEHGGRALSGGQVD